MNNISNCKSATSLIPMQQKMDIKQRQNCDYYAQYLLKHGMCSEFTSKVMFLYAGILEADIDTTSIVPRPFTLRIGKAFFTPTFFAEQRGKKCVINIAPQCLDDGLSKAITQYFSLNGFSFKQVLSEQVNIQRIYAQNWLDIVRRLFIAQSLFVDVEKSNIRNCLMNCEDAPLSEFVDPGDRENTMKHEVALLRLLYSHEVSADLTSQLLNYHTRVWLSL